MMLELIKIIGIKKKRVYKMNIGIDLDGVVFDSEKEYRVYAELYDLIDLKQNSKVNNKELRCQKRFQWTDEQLQNFFQKYNKIVTENSNFMPGAKGILQLLKEEGHSLIVITARGGISQDEIEITKKVLKDNGLDIFDKYYFTAKNKDEICIKEKIDIMVDDSYKICKAVADSNIKAIYLKDAPSYELEETECIKVLYNWGEIYRYIKEIENEDK